MFLTAPSLSTRDLSVATISSDKGSDISPNASTSGPTEKGRLMEWIAWMVLVSYFFVLIGFSFVHIVYFLNVFAWLLKIGTQLSLVFHFYQPFLSTISLSSVQYVNVAQSILGG